MAEKKVKGKPFTNYEIVALFSLVKKHHSIVESKATDAITWKQKQDQWKIIADEFNASQIEETRSAESLRNKWKHMKKFARKSVLTGKKEVKKEVQLSHRSMIAHKLANLDQEINALCPRSRERIEIRAPVRTSNIYAEMNTLCPKIEFDEANITYEDEEVAVSETEEQLDRLDENETSCETDPMEAENLELIRLQKQYYQQMIEQNVEKHVQEMGFLAEQRRREEEKHEWEKRHAEIEHAARLKKIVSSSLF